MRSLNTEYPNFLDKNNLSFTSFHITLDNLFKELCVSGIGASSSHCEGISREEEDKLWSSGVLNIETPMGLLRAVFFTMANARGGQEHRELHVSQFKWLTSPDCYIYSKKSKRWNNSDEIREQNITIVSNPIAQSQYHV